MTIDAAYAACMKVAREHYENFPVASHLMPRRLRPHVAAVYAFARAADDFADEGVVAPEIRRENLAQWRERLARCTARPDPDDAVFLALGDTIRRFAIPQQLFHDLLDAFVQDTQVHSYQTFEDLLAYCRRSADPVGRIVLALHGRLDERTAPASDALCTGLQLVNFWQDVSVDRKKPRVYIPAEDLAVHGLTPQDVIDGTGEEALRQVVAFELRRTEEFFTRSLALFPLVPLRLRLELSAIWRGGMRVLAKIEKEGYTVLHSRPALSWIDVLSIFSSAVLRGSPHARH